MADLEKRDLENSVVLQDIFGVSDGEVGTHNVGPHLPYRFAQKLFAFESLQPPFVPVAQDAAAESTPYSLQWFLDIETRRHGKYARWIPRLLEFEKHNGETLLGLGHGLGTDWAQYAVHGANVIVCSSATSQLELVRRNFDLRRLSGRFIRAMPTALPLENSSIDVACLSSLHQGLENPERVLAEVLRVLKPGGKVLAVTPALYDIDFWARKAFFWNRWFGVSRERSPVNPAHRYTRGQIKRLFHDFKEHQIHKRQLRRSEVPHLWRWIPTSLLARWMGRVLVLKAFKPVATQQREE